VFLIFIVTQLSVLTAQAESSSLSPYKWVDRVLSMQPRLESATLSITEAQVRQESYLIPAPSVNIQMSPLSFEPGDPLGYTASVQQHLPFDLKATRSKEMESIHIAEANHQSLQLEIQHEALLVYADWLEACEKLDLSIRHEQILEEHRAAVEAHASTGQGPLYAHRYFVSILAQRKQSSIHLKGECDAASARMARWVPSFLAEEWVAGDELPQMPPTSEQHPYQKQVLAEQKMSLAEEAVLNRQRLPQLTVSSTWSSMNHVPSHQWMVGGALHFARPAKLKAQIEAAKIRTQQSQYAEKDIHHQLAALGKESEIKASQLQEEINWLLTETLPELQEEKAALSAGFDSSSLPLADVIDINHRILKQEERAQEIRAEMLRVYANWTLASGVLITEVAQ
jgi:outer membrane protein TolC